MPEQALDWRRKAFELFNKYSMFLPYFSFATGIISALMMKRGYDRVSWLLAALFVSWTVVGLVPLLQDRAEHSDRSLIKALHFGAVILAQSAAQEVLFFVLPFYYWSTSLRSANVVFFVLLLVVVLLTLIDPIFERIAALPLASMALLAVANFAALNFALPVVIGLPNTISLHASVLLTTLLLTLYATYTKPKASRLPATDATPPSPRQDDEPSNAQVETASALAPQPTRPAQVAATGLHKRLIFASLIALLAMLSIWILDLQIIIPPAPLRVTQGLACRQIIEREPHGISHSFVVDSKDLQGSLEPVYCYTAIQAPRGLKDKIEHRWYQDGRLINTVPLSSIKGGRKEGYRTWSVKRNFPKDPTGDWLCEARTQGGQIIGQVRFVVEKSSADE